MFTYELSIIRRKQTKVKNNRIKFPDCSLSVVVRFSHENGSCFYPVSISDTFLFQQNVQKAIEIPIIVDNGVSENLRKRVLELQDNEIGQNMI